MTVSWRSVDVCRLSGGEYFYEGGVCSREVDDACGVEAAENAEPMLIRPILQ